MRDLVKRSSKGFARGPKIPKRDQRVIRPHDQGRALKTKNWGGWEFFCPSRFDSLPRQEHRWSKNFKGKEARFVRREKWHQSPLVNGKRGEIGRHNWGRTFENGGEKNHGETLMNLWDRGRTLGVRKRKIGRGRGRGKTRFGKKRRGMNRGVTAETRSSQSPTFLKTKRRKGIYLDRDLRSRKVEPSPRD